MDRYQLEKAVWSDADFDRMGWHDATIWSMFADSEANEYAFDLDYIFRWVHPAGAEKYFRFWVSPVTMIFHAAHSVTIDIESALGEIEVGDLHREVLTDTSEHKYRFVCQEGEIALVATGYTMHVRSAPRLLRGQRLSLAERGGISFGRALSAA